MKHFYYVLFGFRILLQQSPEVRLSISEVPKLEPFNGHFPGEPGFAGVYGSKRWWRWWWQLDYWSYKSCKAPVTSSPRTNQHPFFYRPDALPVAQPTVSKHWRGKISHNMDLLTPSSPGGLPTLSLTTNSSWLPWGRVPMPLISPLMSVSEFDHTH